MFGWYLFCFLSLSFEACCEWVFHPTHLTRVCEREFVYVALLIACADLTTLQQLSNVVIKTVNNIINGNDSNPTTNALTTAADLRAIDLLPVCTFDSRLTRPRWYLLVLLLLWETRPYVLMMIANCKGNIAKLDKMDTKRVEQGEQIKRWIGLGLEKVYYLRLQRKIWGIDWNQN